MHSALKRDGKPLYEYARAGVEVERAPRRVTHPRDRRRRRATRDRWTLDVACSKGTYIRTLAEDIGAALGCGAHLAALRRTAQRHARRCATPITLDALDALDRDARATRCCCRPTALLADWPTVVLSSDDAGRFLAGLRRRLDLADDAAPCASTAPSRGAFLGTAHIAAGELIADRAC